MQRAVELGADMVEIDVRRTRDGVLVAHHDETFEGWPLSALRYETVRRAYPHGLATIEEIVALAGGRVLLDVELKEEGYEDEVLDLLRRYLAPADFVITSFSERAVAAARLRGAWAGLLLKAGTGRLDLFGRLERCGADLIAPHCSLVGSELLDRAAMAGLPILVWTVNDPVELRRHLAHPSIAGVITDVPDVAHAARGTKSYHDDRYQRFSGDRYQHHQ